MLYSGTDPESRITEYVLVYEEQKVSLCSPRELAWTMSVVFPARVTGCVPQLT